MMKHYAHESDIPASSSYWDHKPPQYPKRDQKFFDVKKPDGSYVNTYALMHDKYKGY